MASFIIVDIETLPDKTYNHALYGEPCYITWCDETGSGGIASNDLTQFFMDRILTEENNGIIVYAHNGFNFDYKRIDFGRLVDEGFTGDVIADKSNNYKGIILSRSGCKWKLQDSFIKFPVSLEKLLNIFQPNRPKLKLDFDKETFDINNDDHIQYAIRDAEGLYYAIEKLDALMLDYFQVSFHSAFTAPGLSQKAFNKYCKNHKVKRDYIHNEKIEAICRDAYFGGQTLALNNTKTDDVMALDIHSSYGSAMLNHPMPSGFVKQYRGKPGVIEDTGLYHANCFVPEGTFPLLKSRIEINGRKVASNYAGHINGWWFGVELKHAMQHGISANIDEYILWKEEADILQQFMQVISNLREDKDNPISHVAKLLQNSLYGKFSADKMDTNLIMAPEKPTEGELVWETYDEDGIIDDYLYRVPNTRPIQKFAPHWGAYITALARVNLNRAIMRAPDKVLYCDTDSIFFQRQYLELFQDLIGDNYGQWGIEKDKTGTFRAYGPKAYIIGSKRKNKGIPQRRIDQILSRMREENPDKPENEILFYFEHLSRVGYNGFNSLHKCIGGKGYGKPTSRSTARAENISAGHFSASGAWYPHFVTESGHCAPPARQNH